jgi:AcrR family transcriptional regulator
MARRGPTFTETARRAQITRAAIDTIAEVGYGRASYAQIARRAGLSSTGLISYHFADKADLIDQVVAEVVAAGQTFMQPRIEAAAPGRDRLRAYIESNLAFMAGHRAHITAVAEILNARRGDEHSAYASPHARGLAQLEEYLGEGQRSGELRRFPTRVMAEAIRAAIDAGAYRLATEPDLDAVAYGRELADVFDHATRA